jgi:hypothetical protein
MSRPPLTESQKRVRNRAWLVGLGAAAVLLVIMVPIFLFMPLPPLRADDFLCFCVGLAYLQMGLGLGYIHVRQPGDAPMPRARKSQVISFVLGGVVFLLPIFGDRFIDPGVNFSLIMALFAGSGWATWIVWREADEFMRAMLRDASVGAFHISVLALAVYATAERLGLIGGATAWGFLGCVNLANIACSFRAIYRHGADRPPAEE